MSTAPLTGRVALITGAGRGIGRATALRLAADGAALVLGDLDQQPLVDVVQAIESSGGRATYLCGNCADRDVADSLVQLGVERFGSLDVVVNNAGTTRDRMFHTMDDETLLRVLDANVHTAWQTTQAAIAHMRPKAKAEIAATGHVDHQRKIVFTASVAALTGNPGQSNYTAAKGALIALTKTLAQELGPLGINVNAVAPGFIETRLTAEKTAGADLGIPADVRASIRAMIALGRFGEPDDVARATAFLVSPDSDFVSGVTLPVTGGQFGGMG
ncbi:MAG TPA: SDR family NAD(P)-dependent oxidoreductase [Actinomycetes bacterium]|nr:SDR family NAD(P)-dependent oxidoreductase [Actinomycetes bacterium]